MQFVSQANKVIAYAMLLAFIALYGYGIFVGLKLSEGPTPLRHLRAYFILKIPLISSPLVTYRFCSGLQATVAIIPPTFGFDFRLGSEWHSAISSSDRWGIGVNLVALASSFSCIHVWRPHRKMLLCRSNQSMKPTPKAFASRQAPLRNKPRVFATTPCRGLSPSPSRLAARAAMKKDIGHINTSLFDEY